jgi:hypothetical protein
LVRAQQPPTSATDIGIAAVDLANYDRLLSGQEVAYAM